MPRSFKPEIALGSHNVKFIGWRDTTSEPNPETGKGGNTYTELTVMLDNETSERRIAIFDGGLDLFCNGVGKQTGWNMSNTDANAFMDFIIGKTVKATVYSKYSAKTNKSYRNWGWDPSKAVPGTAGNHTEDEDDAPLPDIG